MKNSNRRTLWHIRSYELYNLCNNRSLVLGYRTCECAVSSVLIKFLASGRYESVFAAVFNAGTKRPCHSRDARGETPRRDTSRLALKCNRPREPCVFVCVINEPYRGKEIRRGEARRGEGPDPPGGKHLHVRE